MAREKINFLTIFFITLFGSACVLADVGLHNPLHATKNISVSLGQHSWGKNSVLSKMVDINNLTGAGYDCFWQDAYYFNGSMVSVFEGGDLLYWNNALTQSEYGALGGCVPVAYGLIMAGSRVISEKASTWDSANGITVILGCGD